jgi:hypothetical protein
MGKVPLAGAAAALVLGLAGGVSFATTSQASVPGQVADTRL